jgi:NIPSNAP
MFQLRIYTLRTARALEQYSTVHWTRHIASLEAFGVTTHGIWTERSGDANRLVALVSFADDANPTAVTNEYMASPEFNADMEGFDRRDVVAVATVLLDATESSPIR